MARYFTTCTKGNGSFGVQSYPTLKQARECYALLAERHPHVMLQTDVGSYTKTLAAKGMFEPVDANR